MCRGRVGKDRVVERLLIWEDSQAGGGGSGSSMMMVMVVVVVVLERDAGRRLRMVGIVALSPEAVMPHPGYGMSRYGIRLL